MDSPSIKALADFIGRQGATLLSLLDQDGRLRAIQRAHPVGGSEAAWRLSIGPLGHRAESEGRVLALEQIRAVKASVAGSPPSYFGDGPAMVEAEISIGLRATREEHAAGRYAAAVAVGQACLELIERELGRSHVAAVEVVAALANSRRLLGNLFEAREEAADALRLGRRLLDPGDLRLAEILHVRALIDADLGQLVEAHAMASAVLELWRAHGKSATGIADVLATLSRIEYGRGRYECASRLAREGLEVLARAGHPDDRIRACLLHHDPVAIAMLDQLAAAQTMLEESLSERRRFLGPRHPEAIEGMASLGMICLVRRDIPRAIRLYRDAMELAAQVLGGEHPLVADCAVGLAFACRSLGTCESDGEAMALLERSRVIRDRDQVLRRSD